MNTVVNTSVETTNNAWTVELFIDDSITNTDDSEGSEITSIDDIFKDEFDEVNHKINIYVTSEDFKLFVNKGLIGVK